MPDGLALDFSGVTKRFGSLTAVSEFTASVAPGRVTGFLGPNGAGKTTTLRILLGLVRASAGGATIGGTPYARLTHPLQTVGAVLEASSYHPGHTAATHLRAYARAGGIGRGRVDDVLGLVGLADAAGRKIGGYSLGMRQRLGLAYALLGDPGVLVLDEPANGLDPEGIRWMRGFLRTLAREGRTVLVSSHLLAEVQQTVDALLIISRGRLVFSGGIDELADTQEHATVVDAPDRAALSRALDAAGAGHETLRSGLVVPGATPTEVGAIAAAAGVALSSLHRRGPALEEVFLDLVNGTRVHPSADGVSGVHAAAPADIDATTAPDGGADAAIADTTGAADADAAAAGDVTEAAVTPDDAVAAVAPPEGESPGDAAPEDDAPDRAPHELTVQDWAADDWAPEDEPPTAAASGDETSPEEDSSDVAAPDDAATGGPEATAAAEESAEPEIAELPETDERRETDEPDDADGEDVPASAPESDDRPWEPYVRTDADVEADRFFAAFDHGDEDPGSEPSPPDADDTGTDGHEPQNGGDQR